MYLPWRDLLTKRYFLLPAYETGRVGGVVHQEWELHPASSSPAVSSVACFSAVMSQEQIQKLICLPYKKCYNEELAWYVEMGNVRSGDSVRSSGKKAERRRWYSDEVIKQKRILWRLVKVREEATGI